MLRAVVFSFIRTSLSQCSSYTQKLFLVLNAKFIFRIERSQIAKAQQRVHSDFNNKQTRHPAVAQPSADYIHRRGQHRDHVAVIIVHA